MALTPVPSLDELAVHPERVLELPRKAAADLLVRAVTVQGVLLSRVLDPAAGNGLPEEPEGGQLLKVKEAAQKLGVSSDWLYRRATKLPFTIRLGRHLRFSTRGIERYIRQRQGR